MDATPQQFAYRCLPLNIANACGWVIRSPVAFKAIWDGKPGKEAIRIGSNGPAHLLPLSHFGSGVLTFHVNALFRTEPGINLFVGGPPNAPKDAIQPLSGIVETDWAPYTFTMNWIFTRPGVPIRFDEGEPFCFFFPLDVAMVEAAQPEVREIADEPALQAAYGDWSARRTAFNEELMIEGSQARTEKWQKGYFKGRNPDGSAQTPEGAAFKHRTKVRLRPFV